MFQVTQQVGCAHCQMREACTGLLALLLLVVGHTLATLKPRFCSGWVQHAHCRGM